ncbi:hypothetical protein ACH5RR_021618 [Cinchona calisaya]|uniref:RNase H type-1 domain-containing protein n=1 Tax=Cinchona calisaya TaxID=153742 RepID=A0ABD2ZHT9_9GENT
MIDAGDILVYNGGEVSQIEVSSSLIRDGDGVVPGGSMHEPCVSVHKPCICDAMNANVQQSGLKHEYHQRVVLNRVLHDFLKHLPVWGIENLQEKPKEQSTNQTKRMSKLNVDGSFISFTSLARGRGLLRDSASHLLPGFASSYGHKMIIVAKIMAFIEGVKLCIAHGYTKMVIESDSQVRCEMVLNDIFYSWHLDAPICEARHLLA